MASAANAQNWGRLATVSATMGVSGSRLCLGEASRGDIGCPAYAPSVTTAGDLTVSGTVTANKFVGDGSGLLNLSASGDRIVSGTLSMLAISDTGYVSLTTAGTNWGYLSSLASFIPVLGANTLSSTNISVTLSHYTPRAITSFAGAGGNYIVSATTSVSASNAGNGSIKMATGSGLVMAISGPNVGIGTATPVQLLTVGNVAGSNVATAFYNIGTNTLGVSSSIYSYGYICAGNNSGACTSSGGVVIAATGTHTYGDTYLTGSGNSYFNGGNLGVGTTNPNGGRLHVAATGGTTGIYVGTTGSAYSIYATTADGSQGVAIRGDNSGSGAQGALGYVAYGVFCRAGTCGGANAWSVTSDARLKKQVEDLPADWGLAAIGKLRPVTYHWRDAKRDRKEGEQVGFIAQEVKPVFPSMVLADKGSSTTITLADGKTATVQDPMSLKYELLVAPLVKAVQELKADNDNLRSLNASLQRQVDKLGAAVESLQRQVHH